MQVKQSSAGDKPTKFADGHGLYLLVQPTGSRYWRYDYRFGGKRKTLALGVFPEVSLKEARSKHQEARGLLRNGVDPGESRKLERITRHIVSAQSFEALGREWFDQMMAGKSNSYRERTARILEKDLYPSIGARPIAAITAPELLAVLRRIEARGAPDIAHRAKQTAGQVFRYAIATARAERNPSSDLHGVLRPRRKKHYAAITDPVALGKLLLAIDAYEGTPVVKVALQLTPLLFQRPGEIRAMEWSEINWDREQWELAGTKTKSGRMHLVPLARQASELLLDLRRLTGRGRYVFPSPRGSSRPLSDNGVRVALRTMGYDKETVTPHGFRASARTLLDEVLRFRPEWIECQLGHAVVDPCGRAYNRTAYIEQRREMMTEWANYLDELKEQAIFRDDPASQKEVLAEGVARD